MELARLGWTWPAPFVLVTDTGHRLPMGKTSPGLLKKLLANRHHHLLAARWAGWSGGETELSGDRPAVAGLSCGAWGTRFTDQTIMPTAITAAETIAPTTRDRLGRADR